MMLMSGTLACGEPATAPETRGPGEIVEVSENKWMNIRPVTIRLRNASEFGDKIVFMPKVNINWPWKDHPVLEELRKAARGEA